ncbi:MAG: AAA family ATPase [Coprothermobacterota bacterium]|nr:AAA family ATPase [Coprothermobacterota bacterium]
MLTKLTIRNFKLFGDVELELGDRVLLIGPNNAGKTSALQALALWNIGVKRWIEKRGAGNVPEKRPGVTINRRDLITVPVPAANLLWHDLHTQESAPGKGTQKIFIDVIVEGVIGGKPWACGLEFYYANEESLYCRSLRLPNGGRMEVPQEASCQPIAYLPPMSGLAANETRLDEGAINVRLGEGRTAEVLRNLCYQALQNQGGPEKWRRLNEQMEALFGIKLDPPVYIKERGEIVMTFRTRGNVRLDISSSGRGLQQTLLLLAFMETNPGAVLLLDEPDAHLEILRQRQIYQILADTAAQTGSQIIAASHSEIILNEAADRDMVIAFVGRPHRIDDRGTQIRKALKEIRFEDYYQAEEVGWVLYLEGSTDLAILRTFAERLDHPAKKVLERPFVYYVANQPNKAKEHFYGLCEAKRDLVGLAIYDRLERSPQVDPQLLHLMWGRRELANYICQRETLLAFAQAHGQEQGELFAAVWLAKMEESISEIEAALGELSKPSPWGADIKASDEFLDPLFEKFYKKLGLPNLMHKNNYNTLATYMPVTAIETEVREKLDFIAQTAEQATPRKD